MQPGSRLTGCALAPRSQLQPPRSPATDRMGHRLQGVKSGEHEHVARARVWSRAWSGSQLWGGPPPCVLGERGRGLGAPEAQVRPHPLPQHRTSYFPHRNLGLKICKSGCTYSISQSYKEDCVKSPVWLGGFSPCPSTRRVSINISNYHPT